MIVLGRFFIRKFPVLRFKLVVFKKGGMKMTHSCGSGAGIILVLFILLVIIIGAYI